MTAEKVPTYLLAYYGVSAPRHANMQKGYYCVRHVTVHALLHYRGWYVRKSEIREGSYLCAIGRFVSGTLIKLRCATIGNNGMVRLKGHASVRFTKDRTPNKSHQNAPYDIIYRR